MYQKRSYNKIPTTSNNIYHNLIKASLALIMTITIYGCSNYNSKSRDYDNHSYYVNSAPNPRFLFNMPKTSRQRDLYPQESTFVRNPWPTAQRPGGYVTTGETITYREYHYSDQYISSDNEPRLRFHRRMRAYREGFSYR